MKTVARKIVLLISLSSIIIGGMLIIFQLDIIPKSFDSYKSTLINLWPVTLIIAGLIFLRDSLSRRHYMNLHEAEEKHLAVPYPDNPQEVNLEISFSFGNLIVKAGQDDFSLLKYEQFGPMPDPIIENQRAGNTLNVTIHKAKPYLEPHFRIRNLWALSLTKKILHKLILFLHDSDLSLDLQELLVESIFIKTDSGTHTVYFPKNKKKFVGTIYSSSDKLSLIVPDESFVRLALLNPFCQVDFPQGDFSRKEDGTILSTIEKRDFGLIELEIDGPLKQLVIDIAE